MRRAEPSVVITASAPPATTARTVVIREREFVTLIGPSGCGKSTLLRIIGGLIDPTSGRVEVRGHSPLEAQRTKDIGFVFQQPALLPWRNVERNIELPFELNRGAG